MPIQMSQQLKDEYYEVCARTAITLNCDEGNWWLRGITERHSQSHP
jgi:hypothetical protein